ncbi:hypothetical protein P171DRAFT_468872 [Karstenula rhodostoma CBS 690.94]|uniref:Uncharacterized protein n=1 Tax=Karstenula rhodostoma CBS 690.94 TaxID=1392251 RepID=A0A9P4UHG1_9PLEO|nr:hypothetical protein P171DRAFT_468872 [Karstenula rhodostoma CBS 690.94]
MQFIATASFLLAALAAASPSSPIVERQAASVTATFYSSTGCNRPADIIIPPSPLLLVQDTASCHDITIGRTVGCTELTASSLTRRIRVYDQPGCPETGNVHFWTYPEGTNNKYNQDVKSYRFF